MNYIKLMRSLKDKAYYSKDSEKLHLWIHLLLTANWTEREEMLGGKPIICKAGQFTTGRKQLSNETGISESKIERILNYFEKVEQQIEQRKTNTNRLISICNWEKYQLVEQQIEQEANNKRTRSKQQLDTPKEYKESEEVKEIINSIGHLFDSKYINQKSKETIENLLKKYSKEEIIKAVVWAKGDSFWSSNFLSPNKLVSENKEKVKYIDVFLSKCSSITQHGSTTQQTVRMVKYEMFGRERTVTEKAYNDSLQSYGEKEVKFICYVDKPI